MIFLDYKPFATNNDINNILNEVNRYKKITIKKAIFDEIHIIENISYPVNTDKLQWQYDTVFLSLFKNNLEAGNISLQGVPINNLKIRRRKKDDLVFEDIKIFDYDIDKQTYEFKDKFVESLEDYVYAIQPMGGSVENPIMGNNTVADVFCEFESTWIVGRDKKYKLMLDLEVGDYETVVPTSIIETLGRQYPFITSNGDIKYRKGNLRCKILSDKTLLEGKINAKEEKRHRKAIMDFLSNSKPKLYKDGSGEMMVISIIGSPILSPNNQLNQLIYDINFDFVEIADTSIQSLINNGLLVIK